MASKNVKKVLTKIYTQNANFHPTQNPVAWNKAVVYIKNKDTRMAYNNKFLPLYEAGRLQGLNKYEAKEQAKAILKAQSASLAPAEQDPKESQTLLPEAD